MSCAFKCTIAFVLGAAAGSVVALKFLEAKYERIAQEEIDSVKEVFARREKRDEHEEIFENNVVKESSKKNSEKEVINYNEKITSNGYTNYSDISNTGKKEDEREIVDRPYVISPSEFGELDDYEVLSLTYYKDHVLTDEDDDIVENIENVVGFDSLTRFGEYEDDSVFVRNDRLKCDYEILYDTRNYTDVIRNKPHQMED